MRRLALVLLGLTLTACGGSGGTATSEPLITTSTTLPAGPGLAITKVVFGERGYVEVTNLSTVIISLREHYLCRRPSYLEIPPVRLEPGETIWVTAGDTPPIVGAAPVAVVPGRDQLPPLTADGGEVGLYAGNGFSDPNAILSYVAWGSPDQGRASVAVEAGIWDEGGFVDVPDGTPAITALAGAGTASGWTVP